ncbi:hypothetical protein IJI70_01530 [Candidatus Saccharibacteria bacterium]|nr:hypothetical protein [Candidatus Saccharibacteria bacterium]
MIRKLLSLGLAGLVVFLSIPYISGGVSVFIGKWAYDWGVPVYTLKLILVLIAAILVILAVSFLKKIGLILAVVFVVCLVFFPTVLDKLNITSNPGELITEIKETAEKNRETIVTASMDLFYQSVAYSTAVNPVQVVSDYAKGEESFWYLAKKEEEVNFSEEIFRGYQVSETKEVGEFRAYRLEKESKK